MLIYNPDKNLIGNTIEIHYWLKGEDHYMDAVTQNRCEREVLGILYEIAKILQTDISIDTEPFSEGGLRRWLKITSKKEAHDIKIVLITALFTTILISPLGTITEKLIDKAFEDTELKQLEKEKLRLEIEKLKKKETSDYNIDKNTKIEKKKSNFYETLDKYPKVERVSYSISNESKTVKSNEEFVKKEDFKSFILTTDELEPIEIEEAHIEIISPVLKKGNYRWTGYYNGDVISFKMKSEEFKSSVQTGKVEFKNGSSINCKLIIKRKVDSEGVEIYTGYDVIRVNKYYENDKPFETVEGKKHRQKKEAKKSQTQLFSDNKSD